MEYQLLQLIDAREASRRLSVSRATFYRLVKAGKIDVGIKLGKSQQSARRWRLQDLSDFMASGVQS